MDILTLLPMEDPSFRALLVFLFFAFIGGLHVITRDDDYIYRDVPGPLYSNDPLADDWIRGRTNRH